MANFYEEDGFVNWKQMVQIMAGAAALMMAVSSPIAAQVAPTGAPAIPANPVTPRPVGDSSAIANEAQGWLADLIKINTSNPPGNDQIAAMYITVTLANAGTKPEVPR